jgi:hypothetical protein
MVVENAPAYYNTTPITTVRILYNLLMIDKSQTDRCFDKLDPTENFDNSLGRFETISCCVRLMEGSLFYEFLPICQNYCVKICKICNGRNLSCGNTAV